MKDPKLDVYKLQRETSTFHVPDQLQAPSSMLILYINQEKN